jgi:hypothetical protein
LDAHDISDIVLFAPTQDMVAAVGGIGPPDDADIRPSAAQSMGQARQYSQSTSSGATIGGAQDRAQGVLSCEHEQRQIAVTIVMAVEESAFLSAVQLHIGGVEIQHNFLGSFATVRFDVGVDQKLVELPVGLRRGQAGDASKGGIAGKGLVLPDGSLQGDVVAQVSLINQILVAKTQAVDGLADHGR